MSTSEADVPYTTYKTSTGDVSMQGIDQHYLWSSKKRLLAVSLVGGILLGLLVGLLIGFLVSTSSTSTSSRATSETTIPVRNFTKSFEIGDLQDAISMVNGTKMSNFVRDYFQGQLLLPASNGSRTEALRLRALWLSRGTVATVVNKMVLISRPGQQSRVAILNSTWTKSYLSCSTSTVNGSISAASVAYAPAGVVTGSLVFVNYGRTEDFNASLPMSDNSSKVAIMRLGQINVNDKLRNAATWGASAAILYHDEDSDLDPCASAYANAKSIHGDPATPSIGILSDTTYSIAATDASSQFGGALPAVSISSASAAQLLDPFKTIGQQAGLWTTLGVGIIPSTAKAASYLVSVDSSNSTLTREEIGMVFCAVQGSVDADRMIFVGAHHDALDRRTSQDAGTGAAIQDELIRILTRKKAAGWTPRRSIVFGSFDATALQIGSREWTESNAYEFLTRGVAYLHLGASVTGQDFVAAGSVALTSLLLEATGNVSSSDATGQSLLDQWRSKSGASSYPLLSGRGDHNSFTAYLGIPTIQMRFSNISEKMWPQSVSCCRQRLISEAVGQSQLAKLTEAYLSVLLRLSDSAILPYEPLEIADAITRGIAALNGSAATLAYNNISLAGIRTGSAVVVTKLRDLSATLRNATQVARRLGDIKVRRISDLLSALTRVFIHPSGVPMIKDGQVVPNVNNRNMLVGPVSYDENSMVEFPGIVDLLGRASRTEHWLALRRHVAELTLAMDGAVSFMTRGLADNSLWRPDF